MDLAKNMLIIKIQKYKLSVRKIRVYTLGHLEIEALFQDFFFQF
jgi:hypothetical protein